MISRLSLIGLFLLFSFSCEKNERVVITGIVIDEVTGNPVAGASVNLKLDYTYDGMHYSNVIYGTTTTTSSDGSYRIVYDSGHPEIGALNIPRPFPKNYYAYASAPGFAGSDLQSLSDNNLRDVDIKLYHFAQLNLHVKNDGINNLKECSIWLDRGLAIANFGSPEFYFICKGQNFDSTFVINSVVGNFKYTYEVVDQHGSHYSLFSSLYVGNTILSGSIIPKPDSITDLFIKF